MHALALRSPPQLTIFDPYVDGELELEACRGFHVEFPSSALLPYGDFAHRPARDVLCLAELGVHDAVTRGKDDDPLALQRVLAEALSRTIVGAVLSDLEDLIPANLVPLTRHLLVAAHRPLSPSDLANFYCRHPKTLRKHLRAAGLPTTNKLIVWSRLFHAAHLLSDSARSFENVAWTLGFCSPSALRAQLQRYVGTAPKELIRCGGLNLLLREFRSRYEAGRWQVDSTAVTL